MISIQMLLCLISGILFGTATNNSMCIMHNPLINIVLGIILYCITLISKSYEIMKNQKSYPQEK